MPRNTASHALTVAAGFLKGATLTVPDSPNLRPSLARVREAIFDIWQFEVPGAIFIDAFAGSGIVGLEALSRGAARVIEIEKNPRNARRISEQVREIARSRHIEDRLKLEWELHQGPAERVVLELVAQEVHADLCFLDPPYGYEGLGALILLILDIGLIREGGELMVECAARDLRLLPLPHELHGGAPLREHRFGGTVLVRYRVGDLNAGGRPVQSEA